jgi:hypothetical protein
MLVGARNGASIGDVEREHRSEVGALIEELAAGGAPELGWSGLMKGNTTIGSRLMPTKFLSRLILWLLTVTSQRIMTSVALLLH